MPPKQKRVTLTTNNSKSDNTWMEIKNILEKHNYTYNDFVEKCDQLEDLLNELQLPPDVLNNVILTSRKLDIKNHNFRTLLSEIKAYKKELDKEREFIKTHPFHPKFKGESNQHYRERLKELGELEKYEEYQKNRINVARSALKSRENFFEDEYDYDSDQLYGIDHKSFGKIRGKYTGIKDKDGKWKKDEKGNYMRDKKRNSEYKWINSVKDRDLHYNPDLLIYKNAKKLAKSKKGRAYYGDINDDDVPDVSVFDKHGKLIAFNGYQPKKSRHKMNMDYLTANPNVTKLKKKDVDLFTQDFISKQDPESLKKLNKELKKKGFKTYKVVEKRVTLDQMLSEIVRAMYKPISNDDKTVIPFPTYKSLVIRPFLNIIFQADPSTLSSEPIGLRITNIVNKKDKKDLTLYQDFRLGIASAFEKVWINTDLESINNYITKIATKYRVGDENVKKSIMESIAENMLKILNSKKTNEEIINNLITTATTLVKESINSEKIRAQFGIKAPVKSDVEILDEILNITTNPDNPKKQPETLAEALGVEADTNNNPLSQTPLQNPDDDIPEIEISSEEEELEALAKKNKKKTTKKKTTRKMK